MLFKFLLIPLRERVIQKKFSWNYNFGIAPEKGLSSGAELEILESECEKIIPGC